MVTSMLDSCESMTNFTRMRDGSFLSNSSWYPALALVPSKLSWLSCSRTVILPPRDTKVRTSVVETGVELLGVKSGADDEGGEEETVPVPLEPVPFEPEPWLLDDVLLDGVSLGVGLIGSTALVGGVVVAVVSIFSVGAGSEDSVVVGSGR